MVQNNVKKKYFEELAFNLQREGFTTDPSPSRARIPPL